MKNYKQPLAMLIALVLIIFLVCSCKEQIPEYDELEDVFPEYTYEFDGLQDIPEDLNAEYVSALYSQDCLNRAVSGVGLCKLQWKNSGRRAYPKEAIFCGSDTLYKFGSRFFHDSLFVRETYCYEVPFRGCGGVFPLKEESCFVSLSGMEMPIFSMVDCDGRMYRLADGANFQYTDEDEAVNCFITDEVPFCSCHLQWGTYRTMVKETYEDIDGNKWYLIGKFWIDSSYGDFKVVGGC